MALASCHGNSSCQGSCARHVVTLSFARPCTRVADSFTVKLFTRIQWRSHFLEIVRLVQCCAVLLARVASLPLGSRRDRTRP
jgi:hypothetical protein